MIAAINSPKTRNSATRVHSSLVKTPEKPRLSNQSFSVHTPVNSESIRNRTTSTIAVISSGLGRRRPPGWRGRAAGLAGRGPGRGGSKKSLT